MYENKKGYQITIVFNCVQQVCKECQRLIFKIDSQMDQECERKPARAGLIGG